MEELSPVSRNNVKMNHQSSVDTLILLTFVDTDTILRYRYHFTSSDVVFIGPIGCTGSIRCVMQTAPSISISIPFDPILVNCDVGWQNFHFEKAPPSHSPNQVTRALLTSCGVMLLH